ncbi:MAG: enoyl-CoA hydratase/isomerase family protein [Myxococcota bacterium]
MSALLVERKGAVATLINNDPPRNRMTLEFMDQLESALRELREDRGVRAILIRGSGDEHFSVGMNLKQLPEGVAKKGSVDALFDQRLRVLAAIDAMPKPVIALMYGYCLGGGLELPLACHFRLAASEGARMGLPELDLGSIPAWGGTVRLTRLVGRANALDIILRARKIDGQEALRIGLVHEVWPLHELAARGMALAEALAEQPALAVAGVMNSVAAAESMTLEDALAVERGAFHATWGTPDQQEGMMAFLQKRKPIFNRG